jgi:hypothetical protein
MHDRFIIASARTACSALLLVTCVAQAQEQPAVPSSALEDSLRTFLQDYVRKNPLEVKKTIRYFDAFVDLNDDGKREAIVYLYDSTGTYCGSGGCPTLVLTPENSSYRVVAYILITRPPIRMLSGSSQGWRSLGVWVQGGGIQPGYEAELQFNGKSYPSNPTVPPARRLAGKGPGEVLIPNFKSYAEGKPLYSSASLK